MNEAMKMEFKLKQVWIFAYRNDTWSPCTRNRPVSLLFLWSFRLFQLLLWHAPTFVSHVRTLTAPFPSPAVSVPLLSRRTPFPSPLAGFAPRLPTSVLPLLRTSAWTVDPRWLRAVGRVTDRRVRILTTRMIGVGEEMNRCVAMVEGRVLCSVDLPFLKNRREN